MGVPRLAILSASALKYKLHADIDMAALNLPEPPPTPQGVSPRTNLSTLSVNAMRDCYGGTSFSAFAQQQSWRAGGAPGSPGPPGPQGVQGGSPGRWSARRGTAHQQPCLQEDAPCPAPGSPIGMLPDDPFTSLTDLMEAMDLEQPCDEDLVRGMQEDGAGVRPPSAGLQVGEAGYLCIATAQDLVATASGRGMSHLATTSGRGVSHLATTSRRGVSHGQVSLSRRGRSHGGEVPLSLREGSHGQLLLPQREGSRGQLPVRDVSSGLVPLTLRGGSHGQVPMSLREGSHGQAPLSRSIPGPLPSGRQPPLPSSPSPPPHCLSSPQVLASHLAHAACPALGLGMVWGAPASSVGTEGGPGGVHAQCVVCLDRVPALLLMPCKHRLCPGCSSKVVDLMRDSPLLCPICRGPVSAFSSPL